MSSFGGQTVDIMNGTVGALRTRTKTWTVPGIDGVGIRTLGDSEGAFFLQLTRFGSSSTINSWLAAIEAMQGTIISITDDHSVTTSNCFITSVTRPANAKQAEIGNGGYIGRLQVNGVVTQ